MTQPAIQVENISKAYRIGLKEEIPDTFMGLLTGWAKAPLRNWKRLRRLNTFNEATSNNGNGDSPDTFWALKDVSFDVQEGEVVGIIGRNGAGKSTLLKILSRITEPTAGRAVIHGRVSSLLEVGTGFHPELTGRENTYMNGTILGMSKREIDRKFDEIVDFSGVEKFLDTPVKRYSSGMKVRLAFAVAAHLEPEILIIDEVLAVGDAEFQKKCLGKMQDVAKGGRTVLFVSHNMAAIEGLCRFGIEIEEGHIIKKGIISDVLSHYRKRTNGSPLQKGRDLFANAVFFKNTVILDDQGECTRVVPLGSHLHILMTIDTPRPIIKPQIGIGIDNDLGQRLLTVHTPSSRISVEKIEKQQQIHCRISNLPLAPGEYSLKIALTEFGELLESFEDVSHFTVSDGEAFGEGRGHHRGFCVAPSEWWQSSELR